MQHSKTSAVPLTRKSSSGSKNKKKNRSNDKAKVNGSSTASSSSAPPGFATTGKKAQSSEKQERFLRHRALFAFRFLVGKAVDVQLTDGSTFVGILDCIDPDSFSIVLKNTQCKGESAKPLEAGSTVIFTRAQIAHLCTTGVINYNESSFGGAFASGGFRTDTEISGRGADHLFGRELQTASSWLDPALDTGDLEDPRNRSNGKGGWNQFEVNEKLFGVVSSFDENLYTTKLDKTKISTEQSKQAERLAREIERQTTSNFHLQEERGQALPQEEHDEEARYSSVHRLQPDPRAPGAYVPPALRNAPSSGVSSKKAGQNHQASHTASSAQHAENQPNRQDGGNSKKKDSSKPMSFGDVVRGRSGASPQAENGATVKKEASNANDAVMSEAKPSPKSTVDKNAKATDANRETKSDKEGKPNVETKQSPKPSTTPAPKKGLNPNAKEFKLSATAAEFTPKFFSQQPPQSSTYRNQGPPMGHQPYGHHPVGNPMYAPMPEEWGVYEGGVMMEESEMHSHMYMNYAMPMAPGAHMVGHPMYPMMANPANARGGNNQRGPGAYGYGQAPYNARFYPQNAPGMPYPAGAPQPPLPRDPSPGGSAGSSTPAPSSATGPSTPSQPPAALDATPTPPAKKESTTK